MIYRNSSTVFEYGAYFCESCRTYVSIEFSTFLLNYSLVLSRIFYVLLHFYVLFNFFRFLWLY